MFHTKEKEEFGWKIVLLSDTMEKVLNAGSNIIILYVVVAEGAPSPPPPPTHHLPLLIIENTGHLCMEKWFKEKFLIWNNNLHSVKEGRQSLCPASLFPLPSQIMLFSIFHYLLCALLHEGVGTECHSLHLQLPVLHQHELSLFFLILLHKTWPAYSFHLPLNTLGSCIIKEWQWK